MRDIVLTLMILGSLPFIAISPVVGLMVFNWLALMAPHRLTFGFAYTAPFAMIVALATIAAWLFSRERKIPPFTLLSMLFMMLGIWGIITTLTGIWPAASFIKLDVTIKAWAFSLLAMVLLTNRKRMEWMVGVAAFSIAFYGVKGGLWWLATGGQFRVLGPFGTQIGDNNQLALGLIMVLPLLFYLWQIATRPLLRWAVLGCAGLVFVAAVGTYSRGGLLAIATVAAFLIWKSRRRLTFMFLGGVMLFVAIPFVPDKWVERMDTIQTYQEDQSANLRFQWWGMAVRIANDRPIFGGGYRVFHQPSVYPQYNPGADKIRDVHSAYFEMLGEQGYVGLGLFLAILVTAFLTLTRTIRSIGSRPELLWAKDLAKMMQVSLIGYAVASAFLTLATFHLFYLLIGMIVALKAQVDAALVTTATRPRSFVERQAAAAAAAKVAAATAAGAPPVAPVPVPGR